MTHPKEPFKTAKDLLRTIQTYVTGAWGQFSALVLVLSWISFSLLSHLESQKRQEAENLVSTGSQDWAIFFDQSLQKHIRALRAATEEQKAQLAHSQTQLQSLSPTPAQANPEEKTKPEQPALMTTSVSELDPAFLDFSLWRLNASFSPDGEKLSVQKIFQVIPPKWSSKELDAPSLIAEVEKEETDLILPVFQGKALFQLSPGRLGQGQFATLAFPLALGEVLDVIVAHVNLPLLQAQIPKPEGIHVFWIDREGHPLFGTSEQPSPLDFLKERSKGIEGMGDPFFFSTAPGLSFYGAMKTIQPPQSGMVLTWITEEEALQGLEVWKRGLFYFCSAVFLLFLGLQVRKVGVRLLWDELSARLLRHRLKPRDQKTPEHAIREARSEVVSAPPQNQPQTEVSKPLPAIAPHPAPPPPSRTGTLVLLYGALKQPELLIQNESVEMAAETLQDYFTLANLVIRKFGGTFEKTEGSGFHGIWGVEKESPEDAQQALLCALQFRIDLSDWNEMRKVEGQKPISIAMGVHIQEVLVSQLVVDSSPCLTLLGDLIPCARSLKYLASSLGSDLLISEELWLKLPGKLIGQHLGSATLTPHSGLVNYFALQGYFTEEGQEVLIPEISSDPIEEVSFIHSALKDQKPKRWLMNNGSQILGPCTPEEIALKLFSQELDFDCECWAEGLGTSSSIAESGMFGHASTESPEQGLWVFDGKTIHGPMNLGFLKTALIHGAISSEVHLCEGSTVYGWHALKQWNPELLASAPPIPSDLSPEPRSPELAQANESTSPTPAPEEHNPMAGIEMQEPSRILGPQDFEMEAEVTLLEPSLHLPDHPQTDASSPQEKTLIPALETIQSEPDEPDQAA
ncbi:MAG: adenylate/guanylate cyclase domain-containing protein [Bdellovibrionia bacterium]